VLDLSGPPVLEIPVMSAVPKLTPDSAEKLAIAGRASLPLIAVVGPTASGKSFLAVALARKLKGEVLACDSTQVYRGFDIGTSKPTPQERRGVPHHLLDLVDPDFPFTAGEYRARAVAVLEDLRQRARLPILTVGTGLYLRALLEGLADAPARSEDLRARLEARANLHGLQYLHRVLRRLDPEASLRIGSRDRPKMIRAIEVCLLTGRPLSEVHRAGRTPLKGYHPIKIGLQPPRAALYDRIERRVHTMLDRGWLDEVAGLVRKGVPQNSKPFDFIGYSELHAHLEGTVTLAAATKAIAQATRRYAKRQLTWFRKEPLVHWLPGFGDDPAIVAAAEQLATGQVNTRAMSGPASD
jgi:tRNA dimethylallyltransferase